MQVLRGRTKSAKLRAPRASGVRPTSSLVKNAIFSILPARAIVDARILDLYAGTGALGIEALARGARWVDFVERSPRMCRLIQAHIERAGLDRGAHVYCLATQKALGILTGPYDLVLADPPYEAAGAPDLLAGLEGSGLLRAGSIVVLEHAWRRGATPGLGRLALDDTRRYGDTAVSYYHLEPGA